MKLLSYDIIDNVMYYRLLTHDNGYGQLPLNQYLAKYSQALINFQGSSTKHF